MNPRLKRLLPALAAGLLAVAAGLGLLQQRAASQPGPQPAAFVSGPGEHFPSQGHCHIGQGCPPRPDDYARYPYNSDPPTSGPHQERFPTQFINPGVLPNRILVHLMEHTNVVLLYNPNTAGALADHLRDYAVQYDEPFSHLMTPQTPGADVGEQLEQAQGVFVAPDPLLHHPIALVAWTRLQFLDTFDPTKIDAFVHAYVGNPQNAGQ